MHIGIVVRMNDACFIYVHAYAILCHGGIVLREIELICNFSVRNTVQPSVVISLSFFRKRKKVYTLLGVVEVEFWFAQCAISILF